jgi:hypothetical protein
MPYMTKLAEISRQFFPPTKADLGLEVAEPEVAEPKEPEETQDNLTSVEDVEFKASKLGEDDWAKVFAGVSSADNGGPLKTEIQKPYPDVPKTKLGA